MNQKIKTLKTKQESIEEARKAANAPYVNDFNELEGKIVAEYNRGFAKSKYLTDIKAKLQSSKSFGLDECGEVYAWARIDVSLILEEFGEDLDLKYLHDWFSDEYITLDVKNESILQLQGGSILINDDGDICLSELGHTEWIIDRKDYESIEQRNELIEAWMNSKGYFPGVFRVDRHGNVYWVNTQKDKEASNGK